MALAAATVLGGCAGPSQFVAARAADALTAAAADGGEEDDLLLLRDAAPFQLKVSEALLRRVPEHAALAASVAAGFTQYAWAFVAFEADRTEGRDLRAAQAMRERALRLYRRAHGHAMAALVAQRPNLRAELQAAARAASAHGAQRSTTSLQVKRVDDPAGSSRAAHAGSTAAPSHPPSPAPSPAPSLAPPLTREQAALAYWAAASWAAWIALAKNDAEVLADLPSAVALAEAAWRADPGFAGGSTASLMGTLEAARPGGSAARAETFFREAEAAAGPDEPGPLVAMAEALALPAGDRARFEALLQRALQTRSPGVAARVFRERAAWLLASADDLF